MNLCFYGAASRTIDDVYKTEVENLAKKCARRGHTLVFGGGSEGCMGAAARGFYAEKAPILGVAPRFFDADGILFPHCSHIIYTDTMRERKQLLDSVSDAYVVAPGGIGTFDEVFEILCLKQLGINLKAVAFFNVNGFYDGLIEYLKFVAEKNFMKPKVNEVLYRAFSDPEELIDYIEKFAPQKMTVEEMKDIGIYR